MNNKQQFEAWYLEGWGCTEDNHDSLFEESPHGGEYYRFGVRLAWTAWQAASKASEQQLSAVVAENAGLKSSRAVLAENTLEACNSIACAGFRHEAIMRGLNASTGNANKYPKPITTLVDEAMRKLETPATDAAIANIQAQGVDEIAELYFTLAAHEANKSIADSWRESARFARDHAAQLRQGAEHE